MSAQHRSESAAIDWWTWLLRVAVIGLASLVWAQRGESAVTAERIAVLQERVERIESGAVEHARDEREEIRKVATEAASQGQLLVRLETTLTNVQEKLNALLNRPRR